MVRFAVLMLWATKEYQAEENMRQLSTKWYLGKADPSWSRPTSGEKNRLIKKVCTYERRLTTGHHRRNVRPFRLFEPEILGYFGKCWRNARMGSSVSCFFAGALCLYVMLCFFTKLLILLAD